tara:strand:+ start:22 stop:459 length:438 start_codon:yes stop_codon:yes gene_type:complete
MAKLLVLHGPNLNLLGIRESQVYGDLSLEDINERLLQAAQSHEVVIYQSNAEHELIEAVHKAMREGVAGIVINPAAFTHTSIALRDALTASQIQFVEVHLSNIFAREAFRRTSYFSDRALGVISGFGANGYVAALLLLIQHLESD